MSIIKKLGRKLLIDLAIVAGIILLGFIAVKVSQNSFVHQIKEDTIIEGGETEFDKNIRLTAQLKLIDTKVSLLPRFDNQFGILVEGDGELIVEDAEIKSKDYKSYIYTIAAEGKSPHISIKNSTFENIDTVNLTGDSTLDMEESVIGRLFLFNDSEAKVRTSSLSPYLISTKPEEYTNLETGENVSAEIKSNQGWIFKCEDCDIMSYVIRVGKDTDITVNKSSGVVLNVELSDDTSDAVIDIPTGQVSSGSIDEAGFKLKWDETKFDKLSILQENGKALTVSKSDIFNAVISKTSTATFSNLNLLCNSCNVIKGSSLTLKDVVVKSGDGELVIGSGSTVKLVNSDLTNLNIELYGESTLIVDASSKIDEEKIEIDEKSEIKYEETAN